MGYSDFLKGIVDIRAGYTFVHTVKAVLVLGERQCGRNTLMKELSLNEAPVKTMLNRMKENDLIEMSYRGSILTKKGRVIFTSLRKNISGPMKIGRNDVTVSKYNIAYLVRNAASRIKKGIEQRDQAILMGADGLTTLIYKKKLFMPGLENWAIPAEIKNAFDAKENDVILVGSAKKESIADFASLNAALSIL